MDASPGPQFRKGMGFRSWDCGSCGTCRNRPAVYLSGELFFFLLLFFFRKSSFFIFFFICTQFAMWIHTHTSYKGGVSFGSYLFVLFLIDFFVFSWLSDRLNFGLKSSLGEKKKTGPSSA